MKLCVAVLSIQKAEERIFKSAESAAKCTDRKPENMLPGILKRLQLKRGTSVQTQLSSYASKIAGSTLMLRVYQCTQAPSLPWTG